MKILLKILSITLVVAVVCGAAILVFQEQKECCLCNSFRYHAPCLVDLQTGNLIELDIYFPHATKVAELSEEQPKQETFSLISLGNVSGYKDTCQERVEISVPASDTETNPALCNDCRQLLQTGYTGRYVLADLYDKENKELIPISAHIYLDLRCYTVSVTTEDENKLIVVIQGNLE